MSCNICPRRCNAERSVLQNIGGFCKMPLIPKIARAALHFGEEPCISGKCGSGTIFFSGCSLGCVYCQNSQISALGFGQSVTEHRLSEIFLELEQAGAHNINLVTPTHYVDAIISALNIYKPSIPIVYNSSGYEAEETIDRIKDYIDVFLFDFKYMSCENAKLYSKSADYPLVVMNAIKKAYHYKNECILKDGIMQSGIVVRHLLMPRATGEAIKIFDWVKQNTPNAYFSLMSQYVPLYNAQNYPEINRKVTKREYEKVLDYIMDSDFDNCYFQDLQSATTDQIPQFNLKGV